MPLTNWQWSRSVSQRWSKISQTSRGNRRAEVFSNRVGILQFATFWKRTILRMLSRTFYEVFQICYSVKSHRMATSEQLIWYYTKFYDDVANMAQIFQKLSSTGTLKNMISENVGKLPGKLMPGVIFQ